MQRGRAGRRALGGGRGGGGGAARRIGRCGGLGAPLRAFIDGRLARYKWPRRWVRLETLPRTALGKVQKAALKALLETPPAN